MSFSHLYINYGPVIASLRLLAYALPPLLLWRLLNRPASPHNLVIPALAASLLPCVFSTLAGLWHAFRWLTALRITGSSSESLVWACLSGSLELLHSAVPATVVLLVVALVVLLRRLRVTPHESSSRAVGVPLLAGIVAVALLLPAAFFSYPIPGLIGADESARTDARQLTLVFAIMLTGAFLASVGLVVYLFVTRRPPHLATSGAGQAIALFAIVALLLGLSFSLSFLPGHSQQAVPSEWTHPSTPHGGA